MLVNYLLKLNRLTRHITSVSLIIIAFLIMYSRFVAPHVDYLSAAHGYETVMDKFVTKNKLIKNKVETKRKDLQELLEKSTQIESTLFTYEKAREFFSDLQAISEQNGCTVLSLNMLKKNQKDKQLEESSGIVTKSALLSVVGLYKDIPRLIQRLQARSQKVWIDSIKILTLEYSSERPRCDIVITVCELQDKGDTQ
ncbi:MAG: hypothetical protein JW837_01510 [Sedimentisphaerales bacterium]|nr:hypothetical protein [Sedimentisphaerales bacterium]